MSFSPDGSRIVTGSWDQTAKVWDARTASPLLEAEIAKDTSHSLVPAERVVQPRRLPHRHRQSRREGEGLGCADGLTPPKSSTGRGASFSPDGWRIVTDGRRVLDVRTGELLLELKGHTSKYSCESFSPDGSRIVTGSVDGTAKVWDARMGTRPLELKAQRSR